MTMTNCDRTDSADPGLPVSHAVELLSPNAPTVVTKALDIVWFQVGGTICNLRCHHCFIHCSPENDKFGFMPLAQCLPFLKEAGELGVKEYYFTGGEPFANAELCDILELTLRDYGPATVLTNATLLRPNTLDRLRVMHDSMGHPLELRVSLDGFSAEMNDPIRGEGTFEQAMIGVIKLVECGFSPIITIARTWEGEDEQVLSGFVASLTERGYKNPRLKILPLLKLGAETERGGGYCNQAWVTHDMMSGFDQRNLVCHNARLVTDQGVWVCPILPDSPTARMGSTLRETIREYPLRHQACHTCWSNGAICSNTSVLTTDS